MQLTGSDLTLLASLAKIPHGKGLVEILGRKLKEVDQKLRTATGEELHRQQGRAQQLDELLADIATADTKIARSQATPQASRLAAHQ